jgi:hypothetical protein
MSKPLRDVLDLESYASQPKCAISVVQRRPADRTLPWRVELPVGIVWRIHHLARAFECPTLSHVEASMIRFDYYQLTRLIGELELIGSAIRDPVTEHYLQQLLPVLIGARPDTGCAITIAPVKSGVG